MSSFKRKNVAPSQPPLKGTKPSPALSSLLLMSTGIPSLDDVLGGGIQLGTSLTVLNPDPHSSHTDLLQKYFIAQGLLSGHNVHVFDAEARDLVNTCIWCPTSNASAEAVTDDEGAGDEDKVKIAWRYEGMRKFRTTVASARDEEYVSLLLVDGTRPELMRREEYCRPFDLTQTIPLGLVDSLLETKQLFLEEDMFSTVNDVFESTIKRIQALLADSKCVSVCISSFKLLNILAPPSERTCTRIAIPACGNPSWGDATPDVAVARFLLRLRYNLRSQPLQRASALVSLPSHLCTDTWGGEGWIEKLAWLSDGCLTLSSASADPSTSAFFPSHHGLLKIHRLPTVHTLVPASDRFSTLRGLLASSASSSASSASGGIGENNLAFKVTRKRFVIETFHLDVEGGVGERRTTPAPSAVAAEDMHRHGHSEGTGGKPQAESKVQIESRSEVREATRVVDDQPQPLTEKETKKGGLKKPKKRVGFQVDRPDVLDF